MDETGRPLYGDVFGTQTTDLQVASLLARPSSFFLIGLGQVGEGKVYGIHSGFIMCTE